MKKLMAILMALCLMASATVLAEEAPEGMAFSVPAAMLARAEDTLDAAALLLNPAEDVVYTSSDELVAVVDENGLITAVGDGIATIVAVSASDTSVYAYMDVAVCNYLGLYEGSKHVDAMNCDIDVELTLAADGTFAFYRAPMVIGMDGGGEMPEMSDAGTFVFNGVEFVFTAEQLGEFSLMFTFVEGVPSLSGKIPTGGPSSEMELLLTEPAVFEEAAEETAEEAAEGDAEE